MTSEEVNAIFSLSDVNKDKKLDYAEVSFYKFEVTSIFNRGVTIHITIRGWRYDGRTIWAHLA